MTEPVGERRGSSALVEAARRAGVRDPRVIEAFRKIARRRFVPAERADVANLDDAIPIGHGQVTTQPSLVARMVEALELSGGERVLEIGTGLGYQSAILGSLAREVYSIERLSDLAAQARDNLEAAGVDNVTVLVGDGTRGLADHAPYDAIVVSAASPAVPPALVEQLVEGGRLVQPIGPGGDETVTKFRRRAGVLVREAEVVLARFVRLIRGESPADGAADFNLLVSARPLAPRQARSEILARLRKLGEPAPEVAPTSARGVLAVNVARDPRRVIQQLRTLCERDPRAFRYTLKWVPVDRWAPAELPAMKEAVAGLRSRIGPGETWRMTVERRTETPHLDVNQVVRSLAELIDARVSLNRPDKVLLVQLFDARVALSVVTPSDVFSVVKVLAARPAKPVAPSPPGEEVA